MCMNYLCEFLIKTEKSFFFLLYIITKAKHCVQLLYIHTCLRASAIMKKSHSKNTPSQYLENLLQRAYQYGLIESSELYELLHDYNNIQESIAIHSPYNSLTFYIL